MADNSTPETSNNNSLSFNDAIASLLPDPPQAENQEEVAAESQEEIETQPSEEPEAEAETEEEADEVESDVDDEVEEEGDAEEDALDEDIQEDEDETPQTFTVKVDGETLEVTLEEALAGYQRQGAFTKKMQELADLSLIHI